MNPPRLAIELRPILGSSIHEVAQEAIHVANTLQITVEFEFNGTKMMTIPGDNYERLVKDYYSGLKPKGRKLPIQPGWYWFKREEVREWMVVKVGFNQRNVLVVYLGFEEVDLRSLDASSEFGPKIRHPLTDE